MTTILLAAYAGLNTTVAAAERSISSLAGKWQFQTNGAPRTAWLTVPLPCAWEEFLGTNFNGVGWYKRAIKLPNLRKDERLLVQFSAAATEAEVRLDGVKVGEHLGAWTPFRCDITDAAKHHGTGSAELTVRLDEKVGHNTQGFLPIVAPHFGGIWQEASLIVVPDTYIDDPSLGVWGDLAERALRVTVPIAGTHPDKVPGLEISYRLKGTKRWQSHRWTHVTDQESAGSPTRSGAILRASVPLEQPRAWSPASPELYDVRVALLDTKGNTLDSVTTRTGFRRVEARGKTLLLNGNPLMVRGVLNWGYYPPTLAPAPSEEVFRKDLAWMKASGFNLVKFCLWIPPRRLLELCDEEGVLAWIEYPTWHPQFDQKHRPDLEREFGEFFHHDRNHPSAILRSLTCETGPSADIEVIRSLYNVAHREIPNTLVEDDSSWIEWNRVTDFYDDHPYGNNHTWVATLGKLNEFIAGKDPKPLVLGEAIAADTWVPTNRWRGDAQGRKGSRPWWFPAPYDAQIAWETRNRQQCGVDGLASLESDSLAYAWSMRKYQMETFRREVPEGGYVISVIRDFATASMGLLDRLGKPKWPAPLWGWQRDTCLLLRTPNNDSRSFDASAPFQAEILVSHFGPKAILDGRIDAWVEDDKGRALPDLDLRATLSPFSQTPGTCVTAIKLNGKLPHTDRPLRLVLHASLKAPQGPVPASATATTSPTGTISTNAWTLWVLPSTTTAQRAAPILLHASLAGASATLIPHSAAWDDKPARGRIVVASRFDQPLIAHLEAGGRVLMLPDGERGSMPTRAHWFLRGAPYLPHHPILDEVPRTLLLELQAFDLAGDVLPEVPYLDETSPIMLLWDTHDLATVKTHALAFETLAGKGRLIVSTLRHDGSNPAAKWLTSKLLEYLEQDAPAPRALSASTWSRIKARLTERRIDLTERTWRFKPDPEAAGVRDGWAKPGVAGGADWKDIHIGRHWESEGYPALDHWAWYALPLTLPPDWGANPVYLSFTGVDDCYELYVDGTLFAKCGDPEKKVTTFDERRSHDLTKLLRPGEEHWIGVRVYDWYGAGGIFRPVSLSTAPLSDEPDLLK